MSELLLGVDVGTSSSKGVLARPDGTVVATAERPHELSLPRPGWAEHDAERVWWLVVLPYFAGERTPLFDTEARGVVAGLTLRHGRGHLYRAMLEGTAFALRHNLEVMAEAGGRAARLVAVGGGTRGGLWTQVVSDVTGKGQELPRLTIGAAYGDAWLAGLAGGLVEPETDWTAIEARVEPNPGHRADLRPALPGLPRPLPRHARPHARPGRVADRGWLARRRRRRLDDEPDAGDDLAHPARR